MLGGRRTWPEGVDALRTSGLPVVLLGGEASPDAELMAASTVPAGVAAQALAYLAAGGAANLAQLHRFLSDTVLLTGEGFAPPAAAPQFGVHGARVRAPDRPTVAVVFYRAHELSGNTAFVDTLCDAIEARGGNALPVYCGSLRGLDHLDPDETEPGLLGLLGAADAVVVTVLAAGGAGAAGAVGGAGEPTWGHDDAWDAGALATLDVPVLQGLCLTTSRAGWAASDAGLSPMDAAMQVALPEFDGRLITVPFSFKETVPGDDLPVYRADPERAARLAGLAVRHAALRRTPVADRRVAVVLSSYPTKHSRVGNAVGLDTPASAVVLLTALRAAGYTVGEFPADSDELIHTLIAAGGHDVEWLTEEQLSAAPARVRLDDYRRWFDGLPAALTDGIRAHWGDPPGGLYVDGTDIVLASLTFGHVLLMIQPPRGFGENPIAIYHDPDLPPSHHYLAAYRWLEHEFGADAVIHLGKHGTLEWLPGKGQGLSPGCAPDAVLGELPLVYPFIVNDPGEGTQAKRRGHAVVVDHLVPPMARADTYGEMAKLEQLLDEYATVTALDPAKLPALRARIWEVVQAAQLHHDLHLDAAPGAAEFDDFVLHVDGYLCEVKDVQIRDGLHILGAVPAGRPSSTWCWPSCAPARSGAVGRPFPACAPPLPPGPASTSSPCSPPPPPRRPRRRHSWRGAAGPGPPPPPRRRTGPSVRRPARGWGGSWRWSGAPRGRRPTSSTWWRGRRGSWCRRCRPGAGPGPPRCAPRCSARSCPTSSTCSTSPVPRWSPGSPARSTRSPACCTPWTAVSCRPGRPARRRAGWSTCCRPGATSTRWTRRPSPRAALGRSGARWPTR